ncbi:hypothetical protein IAT38_003468 [Cryptococcus sp. DSM 104549]
MFQLFAQNTTQTTPDIPSPACSPPPGLLFATPPSRPVDYAMPAARPAAIADTPTPSSPVFPRTLLLAGLLVDTYPRPVAASSTCTPPPGMPEPSVEAYQSTAATTATPTATGTGSLLTSYKDALTSPETEVGRKARLAGKEEIWQDGLRSGFLSFSSNH